MVQIGSLSRVMMACGAMIGLSLPVAAATGFFSDSIAGSGKLLMTGGVSNFEGPGGGALTPWALTSGYGTDKQIGGSAFFTYAKTDDYDLIATGAAISFLDRVELSYARNTFDTGHTGKALSAPPVNMPAGDHYKAEQDVFGAKVRLFGSAVYDQDNFIPQVAVGLEYKKNRSHALMDVLNIVTDGKVKDHGIDYYVSATKIFLEPGFLVNATARMTKANQFGLLGFGGDRKDSYSVQFEGSVAYLLTRHIAIGGEYRFKPNNLGTSRCAIPGCAGLLGESLKEENAFDAFVAYFPNKHVSVVLAYANLGNIASILPEDRGDDQDGFYGSVQVSF